MDFIIYKVLFRALEQYENRNLSLSFKNIIIKKPIIVPAEFPLELKKLSEDNDDILSFQNIEEVIIIGKPKKDYPCKYYLVILCTLKSSGEKIGYLIGNVKKLGNVIFGIWPFNRKSTDLLEEKILEDFYDIMKNSHKYSNICIISK